jgi:kinetochore protein Nuf2
MYPLLRGIYNCHLLTVQKQMLDLKENIENEVRTAQDEYLKMESHIKLYITEMDQAISV